MNSQTLMLHIRIDDDTKFQAQQAFTAISEADALIQAKKAHFKTVEDSFNNFEKLAKDKRAILPRSLCYSVVMFIIMRYLDAF